MLRRIFPVAFDNNFRGQRAGLWLFYALLFVRVGISLVAIFRSDGGAQSADGIPLDSFGAAGAQAVVGVVAYLGLADLLLEMVCVVATIRYRSMVPLLYLVPIVEWLGHKGLNWLKPIPRIAASRGSMVSTSLLVLTVAGLLFSLSGNGYRGRQEQSATALE